jgi:nucleoside-diphosphate-sugar epimerase
MSASESRATVVDDVWYAQRVVVFGGSGFIGTALVWHLATHLRCAEIVVVDIRAPSRPLPAIARHVFGDVRHPIPHDIAGGPVDQIFNLAAVHREPGHEEHEYTATNVTGAREVCAYATAVDCRSIYFTSSIACYGPLEAARDEDSPQRPVSPYGKSKQAAEAIHSEWQRSGAGRRLVIARPGAIYGPGDPGNILRMIRAVRRGWFMFAGSPDIHKSCSYVHELMGTIDFALARADAQLVYNLAEPGSPSLREMVQTIGREFDRRARVVRAPLGLLVAVAWGVQVLTAGRSALHPVRVRKSATPTHVRPVRLLALGYRFRFDFAAALRDWRRRAPEDFAA